jgi:hypothetical protein
MRHEVEVEVLMELLAQIAEGRNEPPLHHYHQVFRKALGLSPLEAVG